MSVTHHIIKPSLTFKADFNGKTINISVAPFACMAKDYGRETWDHITKKYKKSDITKSCDRKYAAVQRASDKGFVPEYVILGQNGKGKWDGEQVFKVPSFSTSFNDCSMGDQHRPCIGTVIRIDGKYRVVPEGEKIHTWISVHYPQYYNRWNATNGVYQRINKNYKATIHCIGDLEAYIYGNVNDVDLDLFMGNAPEQRDAPMWMIEGINSLKKQFYNEHKPV